MATQLAESTPSLGNHPHGDTSLYRVAIKRNVNSLNLSLLRCASWLRRWSKVCWPQKRSCSYMGKLEAWLSYWLQRADVRYETRIYRSWSMPPRDQNHSSHWVIGVAGGPRAHSPQSFSISSNFVLWEAASQTKILLLAQCHTSCPPNFGPAMPLHWAPALLMVDSTLTHCTLHVTYDVLFFVRGLLCSKSNHDSGTGVTIKS